MGDDLTAGILLSEAIREGDTEAFARLMREHPGVTWNGMDGRGYSVWLFLAASYGQLPIIQLLADAGADINVPEFEDKPEGVIDTAASEGDLEMVRWLLDRGAVINHMVDGQPRCFPLTKAAFRGHLEIVRLLVERGAWINCVWAEMTPLDQAELWGQDETAAYLRSVGGKRASELDEPAG